MHIKSNNYKVSRVYLQNDDGEYREIYSLHPSNRLPLGFYQLAVLEIKKSSLNSEGIDKLIEFLENLKNTS